MSGPGAEGARGLPPLAAIKPGDAFPPLEAAWPADSPAPGLLAVGGALDAATLRRAYAAAIFPWFAPGEPLLWWSPQPRMALAVERFRLHRSLKQALKRFLAAPACEVRFDSAFGRVIRACATVPRPGQSGTWITPQMVAAYEELHAQQLAHSVEVWAGGRLLAGLYLVALGRAVFGESMFTRVTDGSKIALAALVAFCRTHALPLIDCQQNTRHLASLGAAPMPRADFAAQVALLAAQPGPAWRFSPSCWSALGLNSANSGTNSGKDNGRKTPWRT